MKATTRFNLLVNEWQFLQKLLVDERDLRIPGYIHEDDDTDYSATQKHIFLICQIPPPLELQNMLTRIHIQN
jgi:hypothetical protein